MPWFGSGEGDEQAHRREANTAYLGRFVLDVLADDIRTKNRPRITVDFICYLHALATEGEIATAGKLRTRDNEISFSPHATPASGDVPGLLDDLCARLNDEALPSLHVAAFALWRLAWIHPFDDGNGRVARALCYYVFCSRERVIPPGGVTLPERILRERIKYQRLLEEADLAWRKSRKVALTNLEQFLERLLRAEFLDAP